VCSASYPTGTSVTLTATPANTNRDVFTGWSGGGCSDATPTCEEAGERDGWEPGGYRWHKWDLLKEAKRQAEVEARGRAQVADLYEGAVMSTGGRLSVPPLAYRALFHELAWGSRGADVRRQVCLKYAAVPRPRGAGGANLSLVCFRVDHGLAASYREGAGHDLPVVVSVNDAVLHGSRRSALACPLHSCECGREWHIRCSERASAG